MDILILTPNSSPAALWALARGLDFNEVGYDIVKGAVHIGFDPGLSWNTVGALLDEEWVVGQHVRKVEILRDPLGRLLGTRKISG